MTMLITDKWRSALCSVFGKRKALKGWKQVSRDILAVAYGIKAAYLFDRWSSSPEQMIELLQLLYDEDLTSIRLDLVVITTDLIIYSRDHFKAHAQRVSELVKFVDVSFSLQSPVLVDSARKNMIKDTAECFSLFVDFVNNYRLMPHSEILPCSSSTSGHITPWYEISVLENVNPSSLFGLFLGYPFVYWFDTTYNDENCLAMHPFRLYKVKAHDITYYNLNNSNMMHSQSKESVLRLNEVEYDFDHVLFSFSVPEEVLAANSAVEGILLVQRINALRHISRVEARTGHKKPYADPQSTLFIFYCLIGLAVLEKWDTSHLHLSDPFIDKVCGGSSSDTCGVKPLDYSRLTDDDF